jgi:transposase
MGKEAQLSPAEKGAILAFCKAGYANRAIARELGRSKDVVRCYLRDPEAYGTRYNGMKPKILVGSACRLLLREASKVGSSARLLKTTLNLDASLRTCQRRLQQSPIHNYEKRKHMPNLQAKHKIARLDYAKRHLRASTNWTEIIWSDEKKFNLDGPDGFQSYWHDLRKEPDTFLTRQKGGGGVMVWGAFSSKGLSELAFLKGNQKADDYVETLENYLLPFGHCHYGPSFTFMQDGASIHRAKTTMAWFAENGVDIFDHPSLSPDLNPIENLWGVLARSVYANGRQFMTLQDLVEAIKRAWAGLSQTYLDKLIRSMQDRCVDVVVAKGGKTKY